MKLKYSGENVNLSNPDFPGVLFYRSSEMHAFPLALRYAEHVMPQIKSLLGAENDDFCCVAVKCSNDILRQQGKLQILFSNVCFVLDFTMLQKKSSEKHRYQHFSY